MPKVMRAILKQSKHILIELGTNDVFEVEPDKINSEGSYFKYLGTVKKKDIEKLLSKVEDE